MVGYVEDLELLNVSEILNNTSLNNSTMSPSAHERLINASSSTRLRNSPATDSQQSAMMPLRQQLQNYKNVREHENDEIFDTIEYNTMSIPNPVGYLQELCVKKGFGLPVYGILSQDGPAHEPTFSTYCHVQEPTREHYRVAISHSKKKGKEIAAREVIMCIRHAMDFDAKNKSVASIDNDTVQNTPSETSTTTAKTRTMNYVGFLQELCVRKQLPPPNYGTEKSTGTPNNPSFYIFCEVGQHREVGIASNKKNAKQMAAEKVLAHLEMLKTTNDSFCKDSSNAENNETLHQTLNIKDIQVLSETALENFTVIPNPVGHLQELCVKYRLRPHVYEIVKIDGPPHCPTFTTVCRVAHLCQEACSSNKKKGKEIAASKILKCLIDHHRSATK